MSGMPYPGGIGMVPYGQQGSGHAGNATSRERQEREDALGKTAHRQREALRAITSSGATGMTTGEIEGLYGWHHGQSSSALTHLHRAGHVARLKERRNGQEIYVCPEHATDRPLSPYNPRVPQGRRHPRDLSDAVVLDAMTEAGIPNIGTNFVKVRKFLDLLP
jgi:hypothetical protein